MQEVILDTFLGGFILGTISYLSNLYGKENVYFYKILAFIWSVPLTFFFFINMASRHGKVAIHDFSLHSLFGTALTFILAFLTLVIIDYETSFIVFFTLIFAIIVTVLYFYMDIYKM
tara:strand:+ start:490 stop:840 length:351 start_codon:yes stop_codon:yes gene_type:complete